MFVLLKAPFSTKDPNQTHEENLKIIHDICHLKTKTSTFIICGNYEDIDVHQIAQYYNYQVSQNFNLDAIFVLPGCNVEEYVETHDGDVIYVYHEVNLKTKKKIEMRTLPNIKIDPSYKLQEQRSNQDCCKYYKTVLGGTFDRLHAGHKLLFTQLAYITKIGGECVIGLSTGPLLENKKHKELIESYEHREEAIVKFLKSIKPGIRARCERLVDPFGPSTEEADLEALVVSEETLKGGEAVNRKRKEKNMKPLVISVIPTVQSKGAIKLSSTELRELDAKKLQK